MKKVAIFTVSMGAGGAERVISLLLPKLIKDYEVHLILMYNSIYYEIPEGVRIQTVYPDAQNGLRRKLTSLFKIKRFLRSYLLSEKIDCVISFLTRPNIISGMLKSKFPKTRFILSERNYTPQMYANRSVLESEFIKRMIRKYYNQADVLFGNSNYIIKGLETDYGVHIPMKVIYNPIIIPSKFRNPENDSAQKKEIKQIVTVGSFKEVKNHALLIQAMSKLPHYDLTIFGDGRLRNAYEALIKRLNLEMQVSLPGQTTNTQETLLNYDLFVLSSDTEGFPNALLEALSVGIPTISTNCLSGPLEMLNENEAIDIPKGSFALAKYGILINPKDVEGLIAAIIHLSSHPELYTHYSMVGMERAKHYSLPHIYSEIKSLIEACAYK